MTDDRERMAVVRAAHAQREQRLKEIDEAVGAPYSGAAERASHPLGKEFHTFYQRLLIDGTKCCWDRDVLRASIEHLWRAYKARAAEDEED